MTLKKENLLNLLKTMPNTTDNASASRELSRVFCEYYKDAQANTTPLISPIPSTLEPIFLNTLNSKTFLQTLGTSLQQWISTSWTFSDPTFTAAIGMTIAIGSILDTQMNALITEVMNDKSNPPVDNTEKVVEKIHVWSIENNITTTLTNNQSGQITPGVKIS
jgi:hypothetical protein